MIVKVGTSLHRITPKSLKKYLIQCASEDKAVDIRPYDVKDVGEAEYDLTDITRDKALELLTKLMDTPERKRGSEDKKK